METEAETTNEDYKEEIAHPPSIDWRRAGVERIGFVDQQTGQAETQDQKDREVEDFTHRERLGFIYCLDCSAIVKLIYDVKFHDLSL